MLGALRLNLYYLNFLILLFIILKIEILIILLIVIRIAAHSYRIMLMDLIFVSFDVLEKNFFFEDMEEYTSYQEFEIETSDFDGLLNYENYALNNIVFLPEIYGGQFALNWEDFILASTQFKANNLNNLNEIYSDVNFTPFNFFKLFNKEYDNVNQKLFFDYIFLYDYYYYHRKSFEKLEFDLKNERFYFNFYRSIFLNEDYFDIHINSNEMRLISLNNFIKELKIKMKNNRLDLHKQKKKIPSKFFLELKLENQWIDLKKINPLNNLSTENINEK